MATKPSPEKRSLLARFAGPDTIERFERSMVHRANDGRQLYLAGRTFWAIYTLGYVVEMCLKIAYLRLRGLNDQDDVRVYLSGARTLGKQLRVGRDAKNLHDLLFWTEFVITLRDAMQNPYPLTFANELRARVQTIANQWHVCMRYWPLARAANEAEVVLSNVGWIVQNRQSLWR